MDWKFHLIFVATNLASLCLTGWVVVHVVDDVGQKDGWHRWHTSIREYITTAITTSPRYLQSCCACPCNGLVSNCNKRVNETMFAGLHNAMATRDDHFYAPNHLRRMEDAMEAGFRAFLLDSCECKGSTPALCHTFCFSGTRDPQQVFDNIVQFLQTHPREVIILEFQMTANNLFSLWQTTSTAFRNLVYKHPSKSNPWPTLKTLIDTGKRLIVFQHDGGNCDIAGMCPEGVLETHEYMFETSFDLRGVSDVLNYDLSCPVFRGPANAPFMLSNHWAVSEGALGFPDQDIAEQINTASVIQARIDACAKKLGGKRPNLLVVDFWSIGDVLQVVKNNNAGTSSTRSNIFDSKNP